MKSRKGEGKQTPTKRSRSEIPLDNSSFPVSEKGEGKQTPTKRSRFESEKSPKVRKIKSSLTKSFEMSAVRSFDHANTSDLMQIIPIEALSDNYMWLIVCTTTKQAAIVDPVEPNKVIEACKRTGSTLKMALTTHNHWDHAGGNIELAQKIPDLDIYGGLGDNAPGVTKEVTEGDKISIGKLSVKVISTPGHTSGHVCFLVSPNDGHPSAVFTGDTLFISGCGNFNSGTPENFSSAFKKLASLNPDTLVYCGHEYTTANIKYALHFDPDNSILAEKLLWVNKKRSSKPPQMTMPSTIKEEFETNPFSGKPVDRLLKKTGCTNHADAIYWVRKDKNAFGRRGR